jgi:hypothetical protein
MFLILSHSRVGGTTLGHLMNAHPDIKGVVFEPFNSNCITSKPIKNMEQLRTEFAKVNPRNVECFKLMRYNILPAVLREWVISDNLPVVFMYRRNLLRAAVSSKLAHTVQAWKKYKLPEDYEVRIHAPLDCAGLQDNIRWKKESDKKFREVLSDVKHMEVCYEDFYFKEGWKRLLPKIYQHVGHKPFMSDKISWLMKSQRVNNERIYLNIENIYEIERECGSDECGWLFNRCPLML